MPGPRLDAKLENVPVGFPDMMAQLVALLPSTETHSDIAALLANAQYDVEKAIKSYHSPGAAVAAATRAGGAAVPMPTFEFEPGQRMMHTEKGLV